MRCNGQRGDANHISDLLAVLDVDTPFRFVDLSEAVAVSGNEGHGLGRDTGGVMGGQMLYNLVTAQATGVSPSTCIGEVGREPRTRTFDRCQELQASAR